MGFNIDELFQNVAVIGEDRIGVTSANIDNANGYGQELTNDNPKDSPILEDAKIRLINNERKHGSQVMISSNMSGDCVYKYGEIPSGGLMPVSNRYRLFVSKLYLNQYGLYRLTDSNKIIKVGPCIHTEPGHEIYCYPKQGIIVKTCYNGHEHVGVFVYKIQENLNLKRIARNERLDAEMRPWQMHDKFFLLSENLIVMYDPSINRWQNFENQRHIQVDDHKLTLIFSENKYRLIDNDAKTSPTNAIPATSATTVKSPLALTTSTTSQPRFHLNELYMPASREVKNKILGELYHYSFNKEMAPSALVLEYIFLSYDTFTGCRVKHDYLMPSINEIDIRIDVVESIGNNNNEIINDGSVGNDLKKKLVDDNKNNNNHNYANNPNFNFNFNCNHCNSRS